MQREIKFRGKIADSEKAKWNGELDIDWVEGFYLEDLDGGIVKSYIFSCPMRFEVIPETVGQFVGTFNGQDLYEGDILRVDTGYNIFLTHVQFDQERGCWHRFSDYGIGKLIGNIHDNKKLVNNKN
jgi:hypothetical protein